MTQRQRPRVERCAHFDDAKYIEVGEVIGCEECLKIDGEWVHLRRCMVCGKVGCCNDSPNKHSFGHFLETGHSIVRSVEPDEAWGYCYADDVFVRDVETDL